MKFFLDTNICIYFLKGMYPALLTKMLLCSTRDIKIASMVKAELLHGVEKSRKREENKTMVESFLLPFEIIPFDNEAAIIYSVIRSELEKKGNVIGPNDLIIAATVIANNGTLITNNENEFKRVRDLLTDNWTKIKE